MKCGPPVDPEFKSCLNSDGEGLASRGDERPGVGNLRKTRKQSCYELENTRAQLTATTVLVVRISIKCITNSLLTTLVPLSSGSLRLEAMDVVWDDHVVSSRARCVSSCYPVKCKTRRS